jgi:hypothetical protein
MNQNLEQLEAQLQALTNKVKSPMVCFGNKMATPHSLFLLMNIPTTGMVMTFNCSWIETNTSVESVWFSAGGLFGSISFLAENVVRIEDMKTTTGTPATTITLNVPLQK